MTNKNSEVDVAEGTYIKAAKRKDFTKIIAKSLMDGQCWFCGDRGEFRSRDGICIQHDINEITGKDAQVADYVFKNMKISVEIKGNLNKIIR